MIDKQNFSDQPAKNNLRTTATGLGDDYTTGCLLGYNYFNNWYKMIVIDLSKQQSLDVDPKSIEQISFIGNLTQEGNVNAIIFFILKKQKKPL